MFIKTVSVICWHNGAKAVDNGGRMCLLEPRIIGTQVQMDWALADRMQYM